MTIPITDTHQHLINPDWSTYSWTKGIPQLEGQNFRYDDYLRASQGTGITRTLFMETAADDWREEAGHVYGLAAASDSLISGVIANCHPEDKEGFEEYIESIRHPKLRGLRRICHIEADLFSQAPVLVGNIRRMGQLGLTFDLCFSANQLPLALDLAGKCPNVQLILDHCGVPDIAGGLLDPWREHIRRLSRLSHLACKISGLFAYCPPGRATIDTVRPYVEHCLDCFGWDRVVWGGDWPVCNMTSTLSQWVAASREIVKGEDAAHQHKLFHENADRIYGLTK